LCAIRVTERGMVKAFPGTDEAGGKRVRERVSGRNASIWQPKERQKHNQEKHGRENIRQKSRADPKTVLCEPHPRSPLKGSQATKPQRTQKIPIKHTRLVVLPGREH